MKALISESDAKVLDERLTHAIGSVLDEDEERVVRMRYGIGVDPTAPLGIKKGLLRNPSAAAAAMEMESFLVQRGRELRGATPSDATEAFFGHGARLGDDAEGEALRLLTNGTTH